jgi:hypothetical protein
MGNLAGFIVLLLLSFGMAFAIWAALSPSVRGLLNEVLKLPDGTTFYLRTLALGLLLGVLAGALDGRFDIAARSAMMEYVWRVASGFENVLGFLFGSLLVYVLLITILVAVLRRRHEQ